MTSQNVNKTPKYTQESPNDHVGCQNAGQTIIALVPHDSSCENSDKLVYNESVFYNVNQSSERLLKNVPVVESVPNRDSRVKSDMETLCHCVQGSDPISMCRQKSRIVNKVPSEQAVAINQSFSSLPRLVSVNSIVFDRKIGPQQAAKNHSYVHEKDQKLLREIKTSSLRRMQSPEIIHIHDGSKGFFFEGCDIQQCAVQPCEHQFDEYPSLGRGHTVRRSKRNIMSNKWRLKGDGMNSDVSDSELQMSEHYVTGECQCACDHLIYNPTTYICSQDEGIFAPAPDVTRQVGLIPSLMKTEPLDSPPYYRSTSASSSNSASSKGGLELTTRHWWIIATVLLLAAAVGVGVPIALKVSSGASFGERLEFAFRLLQETPLIDGHNDLPWNIRKFMHNKLKNFRFDSDLRELTPWSNSVWSHTDLGRLEQGHVAAQNPKLYVVQDKEEGLKTFYVNYTVFQDPLPEYIPRQLNLKFLKN